jgi:hypothetical protein
MINITTNPKTTLKKCLTLEKLKTNLKIATDFVDVLDSTKLFEA